MNYEEMVKNKSGEMVENLIAEVLGKKTFDIRYDYNDSEQWSVVTTHTEEDNEISLRFYGEDNYALYFGYYDEDDDFLELLQPLTPEVRNTIPKPLQNAMEKVLNEEQGIRLPGNFMKK